MTGEPNTNRRSWHRTVWLVLRWGLALAVLGFVASHGARLWTSDDVDGLTVSPFWLMMSGTAYLAGWLPSVWFTRRLLAESEHQTGWFSMARAYYCGHLGKYVPGKAAVVLIRAVLLRDSGVPFGAAALATVAETLALMGTGLALTLALATHALPETAWERLPQSLQWLNESPGFVTLLIVVGVLVTVPAVTGAAGRIAGSLARRTVVGQAQTSAGGDGGRAAAGAASEDWTLRLSAGLLIQGLLLFCAAWFLHGLSLWCVLRAIGDLAFSADVWLICTVAAAGGTSIGFFVLIAPGGLGVREGLIFAAVAPLTGAPLAGAASVLLRGVWIAAELLLSGVLYVSPGRLLRRK